MTEELKNKVFDADNYARKTAENLKASNALFDVPTSGIVQTVDTLTTILDSVLNAKYYTTPFPLTDYVKMDVGRGAYGTSIFQFATAYTGSTFEQSIINPSSTGVHNNATSDIRIDGISIKNNFFRNDYSISNEELRMAAAGRVSFDIIEEKEKARKQMWDLGIQKSHFLGVGDNEGLLNLTGVTVNTSLLPTAVDLLNVSEIKEFAGKAIATYYTQTNGTYFPNRWLMPSNAYMALGVPYGNTFGMPTLLEVFENAFKKAGAPADFKIVHTIYANDAATTTYGRHVLYNNSEENIVRYIPKAYTPHPLFPMGSLDMISQAEGQFTGVQVKKPETVLYIDEQSNTATA